MPRGGTYLVPGRLQDVVLLVQLLALDDRQQIYGDTTRNELGVDPASEVSSGAFKTSHYGRFETSHPFRVVS
jgi:hypothetical protein